MFYEFLHEDELPPERMYTKWVGEPEPAPQPTQPAPMRVVRISIQTTPHVTYYFNPRNNQPIPVYRQALDNYPVVVARFYAWNTEIANATHEALRLLAVRRAIEYLESMCHGFNTLVYHYQLED